MKRLMFVLTACAVAALCSPTFACDKKKEAAAKPQLTSTQTTDGSTCGQKAVTTSTPACGEKAVTTSAPACGEKAGTLTKVASTPACGEKAVTASAPACGEKAGTLTKVATGEKASGCCASGKAAVTTVANEKPAGGCTTPCADGVATSKTECCATKAALTANQTGSCSTGVATTTQAGSTCAEKGALTSAKSSCNVLPVLTYKVGDKTTCCPDEAKTLAANGKMVFVVCDKEYTDYAAAMTCLANECDKVVANYTMVVNGSCDAGNGAAKTCPITGKVVTVSNEKAAATYTVAGRTVECSEKAATLAKAAKDAMNKVALTYRVAGKDFCCDQMAGDEAKKTGATITYVVNGNETPCNVSARVMLAKAKIEAANKALADL